ncbi:MAG: lycopene cyclase domain-containing protein [Bacteroidia bacterium]|nr:lycopene cyclase domain-containing protein [Bacteroidia bacterium]
MELSNFTYASLILFTLSYPLFKSFEDKISYASKWKYLFPGIISSAVFFIVWDILFTRMGVWEFNPDYILGLNFLHLPLEEWLFFIVVPFACVFIYEVMNYFVKQDVLKNYTKSITLVLLVVLFTLAILNYQKLYTFYTFLFLASFLGIHLFILKSNYLGRFYIAWLVCIIPFFIVNGILTAMPVVIYNDNHNLGIRLYTIPIEDTFYGMLNILQVITIYEWLKKKNS